jgi:PAS domain S-box-containing protein
VDDAIFIHDPATGAVLDCNRRACEMYQLPRETILREGIGHLSAGAPPYALADARRWLQRALESGPQRFEWQARRADGTLFWVEVSLRATAIGGQARVSATTRDLTGVREAARALQRSERRFRELADLLPQVIFEADTGGRLTFVNRRAFQLFGYDPVDLARGVDLRQFVVPHQRELVSENVARAMAGGPSAGNEYQALRRDGTTFPALIYSSPALVDGRPVGLRGLIIDVSDRKRTEEERAAMQRRIEEGQRLESIGRLAGGVAHDFNNLLTPILGHAQQVLDRLGPDHPEAEAVRALVATAEQAGQLTRQLLAFSKRQVLQDRELDLNEEVGALHAMLRRVIGEDVVVRLDLAANLGAIRGDSGQLQQVLIDLVANARDAMPGGGVLTIATRGVPAAEAPPTLGGAVRDLVELSVTDTGVGLTEEVRARVFEPFFTARGPGRGAGLGLGTALGVVQQHGGDIEVRSAPGRGTTFRLLFPRAAPARPARVSELALTPAPAPLAPPPALDVRGRTVLVAEDEPAVRRLVEGYLRSAGFEVLSAATGREALDLAARHGGAIDLLLTDVVMPGMNGRELQRALAQRHPGVKVVYMSGYPALPGGPGALEDLVDELLEKPFTRGALLEKLSGALRAAPAAGRV